MPGADLDNRRGRPGRRDDGAGTVSYTYDVHGDVTTAGRTLTAGTAYRNVIDWSADPALEPATLTVLPPSRRNANPRGTGLRVTAKSPRAKR